MCNPSDGYMYYIIMGYCNLFCFRYYCDYCDTYLTHDSVSKFYFVSFFMTLSLL